MLFTIGVIYFSIIQAISINTILYKRVKHELTRFHAAEARDQKIQCQFESRFLNRQDLEFYFFVQFGYFRSYCLLEIHGIRHLQYLFESHI